MKVPTLTSARVNPAQVAHQYTAGNPSNLGAQALVRGLGNLGETMSKFDGLLQQREEQSNRFDSLRSLSQMQTKAAEQLTELKRSYDPSGKGFVDAANKVFDGLEQEYLTNVPPDLQDEFNYRTQTIREGVLGDALKFQYESGDAWFRQGVSDELNKSKVALDQSPELLDQQQSHIVEIINATDLPEAEKKELARQATISLAAITYKAEVRRNPDLRSQVGVGAAASVVDKIIGAESGGQADNPNSRSSANGLGQFIDSTWLATLNKHRPDLVGLSDKEKLALKTDPVIGRQMTEAHVQDNMEELAADGLPTNEGSLYLAHFAGIGGAKRILRADDNRPIEQVLGPDAVKANPFLQGKTVGWIKSWANEKMGGAKLVTDPRFESIPYEDRVALAADAEREARQADVARAAETKAMREKQQNDLYLGLLDGNKGQMDIDNARAAGLLDDYDSVNKALTILKQKNAEVNLSQNAFEKLASGDAWDPTSKDDKDMLNALVKQGNGLARINQGDQNYITDAIVPLATQTGDIPTDIAGTLMGMVRGGSNAKMLYALDSLAQIRDANPVAFNQRVSEDVARKVDLWDVRKDITPQDELTSLLRGGATQSERQLQEVLRSEAKDLLGRNDGGISKLRQKATEAIEEFGGWNWSPQANPLTRQAFEKEFQTLFIDEYSRTGNEDAAAQLAGKALQRTWGVTSVGSGFNLMKFPPEKTGYRAINGSYDWIKNSARKDLQLQDNEQFDLFSDEQTEQEFQRFQRDPKAAPPSYRAFIKDDNGVYREKRDENGQPLRINFEPDQAEIQKERDAYDLKEERFRLNEIINNYHTLAGAAAEGASQLPQENLDEYNAAVQRMRELDQQHPTPSVMDIYNDVNKPRGLF